MQIDFCKFYVFFIIAICLFHGSLRWFYQYEGNNECYCIKNSGYIQYVNEPPRGKPSSTVLGSYVAAHSTCLLHLLTHL